MSSPSNEGALQRPRPVTMAGWLISVGSVFVLLLVFERMAAINTLETREAAERLVADVPGLGLDTQGVLSALRVLLMVAGASAAAAAVLGFHVLRRSRGARVAVTVLAVPLFLSGLIAGGFVSSLVAGATVLLWLEPARDWFAGRPARKSGPGARTASPDRPTPPPATSEAPAAEAPTSEAPTSAPTSGAPTGPRPHHGFGALSAAPPSGSVVTQAWPTAPSAPPPPARRPDSVLWACVLTWVFSGLAVGLMGLTALLVASSPDLLFDQMRRQNPELLEQTSERAITSMVYVTAAVVAVWSLVAGVLAVLVMRRVRWARVALLVSTAAVALLMVLGLLQAAFLLLLPLAASVATFSLLLRPEVRRWVAAP